MYMHVLHEFQTYFLLLNFPTYASYILVWHYDRKFVIQACYFQ